MKIAVLCLYYERPQMLRRCLQSVRAAAALHPDWELLFHDDASPTPGADIVAEVMGPLMGRVRLYRSEGTAEEKLHSGGLLGAVMNRMVQDSDADVGLMLCDDDLLVPTHLWDISAYFERNPGVPYAYSHIDLYDPTGGVISMPVNPWNQWREPIHCRGRCDASQVAWRLSCCKEGGCWFPYPCFRNHDAGFYDALHRVYGPAPFTGLKAQWKGIHSGQLALLDDAAALAGVKAESDPAEVEALVRIALDTAGKFLVGGDRDMGARLCRQVLAVLPGHPPAIRLLEQLEG